MPSIGPTLYTLKLAQIRSVDLAKNIAFISFPLSQSGTLFPASLPVSWRGPKGEISAGWIERGTQVYAAMAQGGQWVIVSFADVDNGNTYDGDGTVNLNDSVNSKYTKGRWITLVQNDVGIIADPKEGIYIGDSNQFLQADPITNIISSNFENNYTFTENHYSISGSIFRDVQTNNARGVNSSALTGHAYNKSLKKVGLDPKTITGQAFARNPSFTESRNVYYEFERSFGISSDDQEIKLYEKEDPQAIGQFRRYDTRANSLAVSLDEPNFLIEQIVGTVVDLYGNILDINRNRLPNGLIDSLSFTKSQDNLSDVYKKLRAQVRKSIALHWELNARKEGFDPRDLNDFSDYARSRSRLSVDVDKEGQFKISIPSSSEEGNVGLLARYENFSALYGSDQDKDRGLFIRNSTDNTDVKVDVHGKGVITLKSTDDDTKTFAVPIDRQTSQPAKLGTGFHDITAILGLHKISEPYNKTGGYSKSLLNSVTAITEVVSNEITVAGEGSNAGGRSGTISLDGFLSLSVGANTIDRQSLWLDTAGGIVIAAGRDRFSRSLSAQFDGDVLIQIGAAGISDDSRFPSTSFDNEIRDGILDIRILNSGSLHTIRVDKQGLQIHTPQRIDVVSEGDLRLKSVKGNLYLDAESIFCYPSKSGGGRLITRAGGTIG